MAASNNKKPLTQEQKEAEAAWDVYAASFPDPGPGCGKDVTYMLRQSGITDEKEIVRIGMKILLSKMRMESWGAYAS